MKEIPIFPDTYEYIDAAGTIGRLKIHVSRVPVYPAFIKIAHKLMPWLQAEEAAVALQIFLSSLALVLLFFICKEVFSSSIKALIVVIFCNISISLINWDTYVLTESISKIIIICMLGCAIAYFGKKQIRYIFILFILCLLLIYTKPFYLFFPAVLSVLLFAFNFICNREKRAFLAVLCSLAFIYVSVFGYCLINKSQNGYFGISNVSVINRLGKVFQYDMYNLSSNEKIKGYIEQEYEELGGEDPIPVVFIFKYDLYKNNYKEINDFVDEIIKGHPFIFAYKTWKFVSEELYSEPFMADYNLSWDNYKNTWPKDWFFTFNDIENINTFALVFIIIAVETAIIIAKICRRRKFDWVWIFCILTIIYQLGMSILGSHGEYARLMVPVYILIFIVFFKLVFNFIQLVYEAGKGISLYISKKRESI